MSMRATSRSSAISRASRSASALTVVSISLRWSSLSLSQRLSSACTKPFTPVSGERSSWATVATRSERSRSRRARPRPLRRPTAMPTTGASGLVADQRGGGEHLLAGGVEPRLLGHAADDRDAVEGPVDVEPGAPVLVEQPQHVGQRQPERLLRVDPEQRGALRVEDGDDAVAGGTEDPVGVEVGQRAQPGGRGVDLPLPGHVGHPRAVRRAQRRTAPSAVAAPRRAGRRPARAR